MSIRRRLATFFIFMTTLVILMGGALYLGGPIVVGAFKESLDTMNALNSVRTIRSQADELQTSLKRYLLVEDRKELLNFEDTALLMEETLDALHSIAKDDPNSWQFKLESQTTETIAAARNVADNYKTGRKLQAQEEWASSSFPKFKKLLEHVAELEKEKDEEANSTFTSIQNVSETAGVVVLVLFAFVIILGFLLFRSLYQSVLRPLEVLRTGSEEFGKGHWDYRIEFPFKNEFGSLAESFNTMAENVRQLQMQAVHLDRMSAVGQLAGGVAHEINNPLTAVLGQTQILIAKGGESDPTYNSLKKIENAALRCKKIVRGLLDFSRPSQSSFEDIDVSELLRSTLDLCEADLKKSKIHVDKRFMEGIAKIKGSFSELQQVLLNLVTNAIQAMPKGGTLILKTIKHSKPITIVDRRKGSPPRKLEGSWVEVQVKDTGVGISQDHLNRIFEPFFTTKEIGQGTGLGLAVSMGIVQKHGGDLRAESEGLERGTSFYLTLPVSKIPVRTSTITRLGRKE